MTCNIQHWQSGAEQKHQVPKTRWQHYPGDLVAVARATFKHQASMALTMDDGVSMPPLSLIVCPYTRTPFCICAFPHTPISPRGVSLVCHTLLIRASPSLAAPVNCPSTTVMRSSVKICPERGASRTRSLQILAEIFVQSPVLALPPSESKYIPYSPPLVLQQHP